MISVRDAGGLANIGAIKVRDAGGLAPIAQLYIRDAGGLHPCFSTFSASASPTYNYGSGYSFGPIQVTTGACVVSTTGGGAPFTYNWIAADSGWEAVAPTSAATSFRSPALAPGDDSSTDFTCEVTDAFGNTVITNAVTAVARNNAGA